MWGYILNIDYDQILDILGVKMGEQRVKMYHFLEKANIMNRKIAYIPTDCDIDLTKKNYKYNLSTHFRGRIGQTLTFF